jgi:heme/copper-type cytochrome/quinol oxidase subunit 3
MTTIDETAADAPRTSTGRALLGTQAALLVLFALLVVVPYYAHGLNHEPTSQVEGGRFDPAGFAPYDLPVIGVPLQYLLALVGLVGWLLAGVLSLWAAVRTFASPVTATRARFAAAAVLGAVFVAIQFSSYGRHLGLWIAD